eukprot:5138093-Pleurochrysis_carterae.AAC.1
MPQNDSANLRHCAERSYADIMEPLSCSICFANSFLAAPGVQPARKGVKQDALFLTTCLVNAIKPRNHPPHL